MEADLRGKSPLFALRIKNLKCVELHIDVFVQNYIICLSFSELTQRTFLCLKKCLNSIVGREVSCCKLLSVSFPPRSRCIIVILEDYSLPFALLKVELIFQELTIALDALLNGSNWCREKRKMDICESMQILS